MKNVKIFNSVKGKILDDFSGLPPHSRIPARTELMKKYNVARSSVEKAVAELIGEGFLYSMEGAGTFIADRSNAVKGKKETSNSWGIIIPNVVHDTYPEIIRGIESIASLSQTNIVLYNTDSDVKKQNSAVRNIIELGLQGAVIVPAVSNENQLDGINALKENNIPFVFCNRGVPGMDAPLVVCNNYLGISLLMDHLFKLGYCEIAFIANKFYIAVEQRYQSYLACLSQKGIPINKDWIYFEEEGRSSMDSGYYGTMKVMQQKNPPKALVCFNDRIAMGALKAVNDLGLVVGKDIAITGYDNAYICEAVKLTTVNFPKYDVGVESANVLRRMINGEMINDTYYEALNPTLVVRESCGESSRLS